MLRTQKWNTNNGTVIVAVRPPSSGAVDEEKIRTDHVPQAFSHWSFVADGLATDYVDGQGREQKGRLLCCDIQGCYVSSRRELTLNDPVIHSQVGEKNLFGLTDHGSIGISTFLKRHKCNALCRALGIPDNFHFLEEKTAELQRSSRNTSGITVIKTHHLEKRLHERAIRTRHASAGNRMDR